MQVLLLLVALIAVPCMLLPKPLILRRRFLKRQAEVCSRLFGMLVMVFFCSNEVIFHV